jgi:hypothetical protein
MDLATARALFFTNASSHPVRNPMNRFSPVIRRHTHLVPRLDVEVRYVEKQDVKK